MKVQACKDPSEVARHCADRLVEIVGATPDPVLILPAGSTPLPLFEELVRRVRAGLDLSGAHIFQLDELVGIGPDHRQSFHCLLQTHLLRPIGHPAERTHLIDGTAGDPGAEIARQARELEALGGADVAVLGIGLNGHVAFNEPGSTLDSPARPIQLDDVTREAMNGCFAPDENPDMGITLGLREISASRVVYVLATGGSKSEVLHAMLTTPPSPALPASLLLSHPALTILADDQARARLAPAS